MNRSNGRNVLLSRRWTRRDIKTIATLVVAFIICSTAIYLSIKFIIYSFKPDTTTQTTQTTTTTTTTTPTTSTETTTEKPTGIGCFFDKTNITLADGSIRPLHSLTTGDHILVYSSSGQLQQSRVLTIFRHYRPTVRFLDIYTTNDQEPLRLTPSHSILIQKNDEKTPSYDYDFASNIVIGDFVISSKLKPLRVINIKEILLYNQTISTPLTFEGNIIVNNLIASCYATYHHKLMHLLTTPIRYWYQIETFSRINFLIVHFIDFYSKTNV